MRRRIFIAINLPQDIKKQLVDYEKKWFDLPIRWTKFENLHITLAFLGYIREEELEEVSKIVKEVAEKSSVFKIVLNKICYGPFNNKETPKMVWATGEKSKEVVQLKKELDKRLGILENREFKPHITLGRIRKWDWQRIDLEERPEIDEDINFSFEVKSIEIMESHLKRGGPYYEVLMSVPF